MYNYRVYDEIKQKVLFTTTDYWEAIDWVMSRKNELDKYNTFVDELDKVGKVISYWQLDDLIDELPDYIPKRKENNNGN